MNLAAVWFLKNNSNCALSALEVGVLLSQLLLHAERLRKLARQGLQTLLATAFRSAVGDHDFRKVVLGRAADDHPGQSAGAAKAVL